MFIPKSLPAGSDSPRSAWNMGPPLFLSFRLTISCIAATRGWIARSSALRSETWYPSGRSMISNSSSILKLFTICTVVCIFVWRWHICPLIALILERSHDTASKGCAVENCSTVLSHLAQQVSFNIDILAHYECMKIVWIHLHSDMNRFLRLPQYKRSLSRSQSWSFAHTSEVYHTPNWPHIHRTISFRLDIYTNLYNIIYPYSIGIKFPRIARLARSKQT